MSEAGCYTEECTFTGPDNGALSGPCTGTPSYIGNWEIDQIISNSQYESAVEEYYSEVAGDILVYDSTQWISWMKPSTYNSRSEWVQGINFGGTCDWAMDVNASYAPNGITTTLYVAATTITTITLPLITTDTISIWNVEWTNSLNNTLYPTSSIVPPVTTPTESPDAESTNTLPGIIYTYAPGPYPPIPTRWPPIINPPPSYTFG
jgi:chitinase